MTGLVSQDEKIFISCFYDSLCNDNNKLMKFYTDKTVSTVSFENGSKSIFTDGFKNHIKNCVGKPVTRVFISNFVSQKVEENIFNLSVVGQFVFSEKNQKRFSHNFIIQRFADSFFIKFETLVFLNEEIVYDKIDNSYNLTISNKSKSISDVVNILEEFGTIEEIKVTNENYECKMGQLDIKFEDMLSKISEKGLLILSH